MARTLYPLSFKPILKDVIWGGTRLRDTLGKNCPTESCGESWEISGVQGKISVVSNGFLKGNNLEEIIEIYMGDLLGDHIYEKFGLEFPLLIKYIDANDLLSIQVHPDDELASERHNAYGKTEMWYIIEAEKDAKLISGFRHPINRETYLEHFNNKTLPEILNYEKVSSGDVFFMPAGRVHSIGAGILLAEIQQTSDITYRIYDWDRLDKSGKGRELHTDLAVDAIVYDDPERHRIDYQQESNSRVTVVDSPWFITGIINFDTPVEKDFTLIDSFVIYMCVQGKAGIEYEGPEAVKMEVGETLLIPASLKNIRILPEGPTRLLEIFIK
ncbi:type I phosphomannose isomerase catalytic subunit [Bacteroidota bacterium]